MEQKSEGSNIGEMKKEEETPEFRHMMMNEK